jgi:Eukaryotic aspartyl protease
LETLLLRLSRSENIIYLLKPSVGPVLLFHGIDQGHIFIASTALVNDTKGLGLSSTGNSGIIGLSFPLPASIPATSGRTLLENVFASLDDYNRFFAYKLGRNQNQDQSQVAGFTASSFTVGQLDPAVANDTSGFQFTPVITLGQTYYDYWKLPLLGITVDSNPLRLSPSLIPGSRTPVAVLDTGTTLILGPSADVINFWSAVGGNETTRKNLKSGMWEVRCSRAANVSFMLGDASNPKEYVVHPGDINWGEARSPDGWCMGGIQANDAVSLLSALTSICLISIRLGELC